MSAVRQLSRDARQPALLAAPALLYLLVFYWQGLLVWFQADDFAWMSQWHDVRRAGDLWSVLFEPRAQGSIRPLSERAFFLGLQSLFGWNPLPFRMVVFATQALNLVLLASIALRITGSRIAAGTAAFFWAASTAIAVPMMWSSVYNQILCAALLLGAFRAWIVYCDTGAPRWLAVQWALFLVGFGALEIMVMFPVVALGWVPGWRRWRAWAPLFAASALYTVLHQWASPTLKAGAYALHFDASLVFTFAEYMRQIFGAPLLSGLPLEGWIKMLGEAVPFVLGLPLLFAAAWRRQPAMLVPLALIVAPLVPVLPLRDHITHYYLAVPAAGLALALGWLLAELARGSRRTQAAALAMTLLFLLPSGVVAGWNRDFWFKRGQGVRALMLGLVHARAAHPPSTLVVTGIDGQKYYASFASGALRAFDLENIFLSPGSQANIDPRDEERPASSFELALPAFRHGLMDGSVLVFSPAGDRLRNVTPVHRALEQAAAEAESPVADRVEPASPIYRAQLGAGWLAPGGGARWMPQRASVMAAPQPGARKLVVEGYCPTVQFSRGPFRITATVLGTSLKPATVAPPGGPFRLEFPLPQDSPAGKMLEIVLEADHTVGLPGGDHASILVSAIFFEAI